LIPFPKLIFTFVLQSIDTNVYAIYNDGTKVYNALTEGEDLRMKSCRPIVRNLKEPVLLSVAYSSAQKELTVWLL
jgi:hypothetical protein